MNRQEVRDWAQTIGVVAIPFAVGIMGYRGADCYEKHVEPQIGGA